MAKDSTRDIAITIEDLRDRIFARVPEAAAILQLDPRTVRAALNRGEIPGTRVGQHWRVPVAWLRTAASADQAAGGAA